MQNSRGVLARVHDIQTRQETALVLAPREHPSRDTVARPHGHRGCPAPGSRIHRAFLGAGYSYPSHQPAPNPAHLASSSTDVWTLNDLVTRVGIVERSAALKALLAWVDRGVLREDTEDVDIQSFRLLERVPEDAGDAPVGMTTAGSRTALAEEEPAVLTVQQQQAEQMKVYWKVRHLVLFGPWCRCWARV